MRTEARPPTRVARADVLGWGLTGLVVAVGATRAAALVREGPGAGWRDGLRDVRSDAVAILLVLVASAGIVAATDVLDRSGRHHPLVLRKAAHVAGALVLCAGAPAFASHWSVLVVVATATVLLAVATRADRARPLGPGEARSAGAIVFPAGLYLAYVLAHGSIATFQAAALTLGVSDVAAALAGGRWGAPDWWVAGTWRSRVGSFVFFVTTAVVVVVVGTRGLPFSLARVVASALVAGASAAIEAVAPRGLDNLSVPVGASLLLEAARRAL